jgi:lysine-N-methylase
VGAVAEGPPPGPGTPAGVAIRGQLVGRLVAPEDNTRPIHVPLLRASCDGSGACCSLFHHVPATAQDAREITGLLSDSWHGPVPLDQLFYPAFDGYSEPLNVVEVEGDCGLLDEDGLCRVHAAGGAQAKPQSCLAFPAELVACGDEWHASLRPECACIARTAVTGAPLQADPHTWAALRTTLLRVWEVPESVRVDETRSIPRDEYLDWMRRTMAALKTTFSPSKALTAAVQELSGSPVPERPPPGWLASIADDLEATARELVESHPPTGAYRRAVEWGARASRALHDGADPAPPWGRGLSQHQGRLASSVAGLLLHGHALLHYPLLGRAAADMTWLLWLARASCAVQAPEEVDPRLEANTTWVFLWRHVGWS